MVITAEARSAAEKIWQDRCTPCHGPLGDGNGLGARVIGVPPRDFTNRAWQAAVSDERIAKVIVDGGASVGLAQLMPANADLASQREVLAALVEYVRGLGSQK